MSTTDWLGSQKAPRRWTRSLDTGRLPSIRSSGTRSSHLPTSDRSSGADGSVAGSSTTKIPGPECLTGRPHGAGPSAIRPTERISSGALRSSGIGLGLVGRRGRAGDHGPAVPSRGPAYRLTIMDNAPGGQDPRPPRTPGARLAGFARTPAGIGALVVVALAGVIAVGSILGGAFGSAGEVAAASPSASMPSEAMASAAPSGSPTTAALGQPDVHGFGRPRPYSLRDSRPVGHAPHLPRRRPARPARPPSRQRTVSRPRPCRRVSTSSGRSCRSPVPRLRSCGTTAAGGSARRACATWPPGTP